jgi:probable HAF family extracellular repeat protein
VDCGLQACGDPWRAPDNWASYLLTNGAWTRVYGCKGSDLNNAGEVTGTCGDQVRTSQAWRWKDGVASTLGGSRSNAHGINDVGQVVGYSDLTNGDVVWKDSVVTGTGFSIDANDINNAGLIVGGLTHAYLLTPIRATPARDAIVDLGTLPGETSSSASAINSARQAIGVSGHRAFLWDDGTMTDLGNLGGPSGTDTVAGDVNERSQVVGSSYNASGYQRAFLWENGVIKDLGSPTSPYPVSCSANGINNRGQVVGWCVLLSSAGTTVHAILWQGGTMIDLGTPDPLRPFNRAMAINDAGQVIVENTDGSTAAPVHYVWQGGTWTPVGIPPGRSSFLVADINRPGQLAGTSGWRLDTHYAYRWDAGVFTSLGSLGPVCCTASYAYGINDPGQIVGESNGRPFIWDNGTMTDLGGLGYGGGFANDINDAGRVVGQVQAATDPSVRHAVLWSSPARHDAGVTSASASPSSADVGTRITIVASVQNFGTQRETFNVQASTGSTVIGVQPVTNLPAGASADVSFSWDTSSAAPGSYPIEVLVRGVPGDANSSNDVRSAGSVALYAAVIVHASASPDATDIGFSVKFSCSAEGGAPPYKFRWSFGDGTGDPSATPSHIYTGSGTVTAVCTATDARARDTTSSTTVHVDPAPTASATVNSSATTPGRGVTFSATGAGGSGTYTYNWGFGDGTSAKGARVEHVYASAGQYTAVLTIYDSRGASASNTVTVAVAASSTTTATTSTPITFTAAGTDGGGIHLTITWYFGDGTSDSGAKVTHAYGAPGSYRPRVTVTDSSGRTSEAYLDTITIRAASSIEPSPGPAPSPSPSASSTPISFGVVGGILSGAVGMAVAVYLARRRPRRP